MSLIRTRLSIMMFLEFFIWGAWLPLIFGYLPSFAFSAWEAAWILNAFAISSVVGMFFSNQFADRNFAAERFLAFSQLVGGAAIMGLYFVRPGWTAVIGGHSFHLSFWAFFLLMLVHCLFYVPTISITNSIAFANVKNPQHDFGLVRLWGTIGWIAASWPFVFILVDWQGVQAKLASVGDTNFVQWLGIVLGTPKTEAARMEAVRYTYVVAGLASLLLAGLSVFLPHTPPRPAATAAQRFAWLEAMQLLKLPFVLVLFVVTFVDAAVHQCYFIWTDTFLRSVGIPGNWVMPAMSIGQIAEIGTMAVLGLCLKRLGWRNIMVVGILGHMLRFAVFALLPMPWLAVAVNVVHGICYAFFFATVYIFVDEFFPKDARSSAQGLFNFLILGIGPFVANFLWPNIGEMVKTVDVSIAVVAEASRQDVVVKGYINNPATPPLGIEKLTIEQPGRPPYEQQVALNADRRFELVLGPPEKGHYAVTVPWQRGHWFVPPKEAKVKVDLDIVSLPSTTPQTFEEALGTVMGAAIGAGRGRILLSASAKDFDYQRLFLFPSATALAAAIFLGLFFRPPVSAVAHEVAGAKPPH